MTGPFQFEWPVDQAGYDLVHVPAREGGSLLSSDSEHDEIRPRGGPPRYYRPMDEHPGLWRRFAETCGSADGILGFVTEFGLLGDGRPGNVIAVASFVDRIADSLDAGAREDAVALFNGQAMSTEYIAPSPSLTAGIVRNERSRAFEFKLVPRDLISAILVQAGEAITGNRRFRHCKNCPEWFPLGVRGRTERREFCSDRCRVASARRHKREASANA
jgi:hypothetical protein